MALKNWSRKKKIFLSMVCLTLLGGSYLYFDVYKDRKLDFNLHDLADGGKGLEGWKQFSPENERFSIYFPDTPKSITRDLPIPGGDESLPYQEYQIEQEEGRTFSVSYTTLPDKWMKWGSGLVLKGALRVITHELGKVELVGKSSNTFKGYEALDYEHYTKEKETTGTLILVGNKLYKVEMVYPLNSRQQSHKLVTQFIQTFAPEKEGA